MNDHEIVARIAYNTGRIRARQRVWRAMVLASFSAVILCITAQLPDVHAANKSSDAVQGASQGSGSQQRSDQKSHFVRSV